MERRLTRNTRGGMLGGVAAGLADYFNVDPVLIRLALVVLAFVQGIGLIFYLVAWVIMPKREEPDVRAAAPPHDQDGIMHAPGAPHIPGEPGSFGAVATGSGAESDRSDRAILIAGIVLVVIGVLLLFDRVPLVPWFSLRRMMDFWPAVLIVIGVWFLARAARRRPER